MITEVERKPVTPARNTETPNGPALAALLAAALGAFAVGLLVILSETRIYEAPALYGPAGGVSGRTTFAAAVWLVAWTVLARAWQGRQLSSRPVYVTAAFLTGVGLLLTFPPFWEVL